MPAKIVFLCSFNGDKVLLGLYWVFLGRQWSEKGCERCKVCEAQNMEQRVLSVTICKLYYKCLSSMIFSLFFYIEEQNLFFTFIIISTYFFMTLQNLPNISNIALNKLERNFYASLLVLISVGLGYFFISNAEYYIFSYLIGFIFSTAYLFNHSS